jgi:hypothetical protein
MRDLDFRKWRGHALTYFISGVPLVAVALRIAKEVQPRKLAFILLYRADDRQMPFTVLILSIEYHSLTDDVLVVFQVKADVCICPIAQIGQLAQPPEISVLLAVFVFFFELFSLLLVSCEILARLLRALRVGDVDQSVHLRLYVDAKLFVLRVVVVLAQVALQCLDGAAFKELHRLTQFFAFVTRRPHQLQFLVQRL